MVDKEKITELIQKCLNLSKSPNENEAARAMEKAQELLEKYNLSMADLPAEEKQEQEQMLDFPLTIGSIEWKRYLLHYVARNNFCRILISRKNVNILGRQANVYAVLAMASWIVAQLESIAWVETSTYDGPTPKLKFRNSFLWGAINRINERLREKKEARQMEDPTLKALVLDLDAETNKFFYEKYPFTGTHSGGERNFAGEAYQAGKAAGDRISLSGEKTVPKDIKPTKGTEVTEW